MILDIGIGNIAGITAEIEIGTVVHLPPFGDFCGCDEIETVIGSGTQILVGLHDYDVSVFDDWFQNVSNVVQGFAITKGCKIFVAEAVGELIIHRGLGI